jgi:hypothetical protein
LGVFKDAIARAITALIEAFEGAKNKYSQEMIQKTGLIDSPHNLYVDKTHVRL